MAPDCAYQTKVFERLRLPRGVTAIVGGGGKTTLMERLALELASAGHTVLVTTTTRIFPPEAMPVLISPTPEAISHALCAHAGGAGVRRRARAAGQAAGLRPAHGDAVPACGVCARRGRRRQASAAEGAGSA